MALHVARSLEQWRRLARTPAPRSVLSVGNFDGLHLGHQKILRSVVECARAFDCQAVAVTFDPHPLRILRPEHAPPLIATLDQRLAAMQALEIDAVLVLPFTEELARLPAEEFVRLALAEHLRARAILVGENFRFGHRQAGDVSLLTELGRQWDFEVEIIAPVLAGGVPVSSSAIRKQVLEGKVAEAASLLGRPFSLSGQIQGGTGRGRKLLFPTLNLAAEQELRPQIGVYVTESVVDGRPYHSATNVGVRPTFDGGGVTVESHLLDFSQSVESGSMEVHFLERLRDERRFAGPEELRAQIAEDIRRARQFFSESRSALTSSRSPKAETH